MERVAALRHVGFRTLCHGPSPEWAARHLDCDSREHDPSDSAHSSSLACGVGGHVVDNGRAGPDWCDFARLVVRLSRSHAPY